MNRNEESAFWLLAALVEDILHPSTYSKNLEGCQVGRLGGSWLGGCWPQVLAAEPSAALAGLRALQLAASHTAGRAAACTALLQPTA
jgi:hypothetical protein